jgi:TonB family protein
VLHLDDVRPDTPRLPHWRLAAPSQVAASAILHAAGLVIIVALLGPSTVRKPDVPRTSAIVQDDRVLVQRLVFLATAVHEPGGGGGGGNREPGPIRRAEGIGSDALTLRVRKPPAAAPIVTNTTPAAPEELAPAASIVLDARPLASGSVEQIGLPTGGVSYGTSMGSGSGGGVGTGVGTGIGPGRGPGVGPGSGGGIGGGVYRPGGAVTSPRVITEVKPTYTTDALAHRLQGTVVLELVVTRDGRPSQIRVIRSLDPEGLDQRAVAAAAEWRFEPGRLAGTPVDVLVTLMLDFRIR